MTDTTESQSPPEQPASNDAVREALIDLADAARSEWDTANRASPKLTEALAAADYALSTHTEAMALLRQVSRCAYPVSTEINQRGYNWSEAYLDQVKPRIDNLLGSADNGG